jgi:hypothetical protein
MKIYRSFPERLHHRVPHWVEPGAQFHVRIRLDREKQQRPLIEPSLAQGILDSAIFYDAMTYHAVSADAGSRPCGAIFRA